MSDEPTNLVLEHLRHIRGTLGEMQTEMRDHRERMADMDMHILGTRSDMNSMAGAIARIQVRLDRISDDVSRIKRRLDMEDAFV